MTPEFDFYHPDKFQGVFVRTDSRSRGRGGVINNYKVFTTELSTVEKDKYRFFTTKLLVLGLDFLA